MPFKRLLYCVAFYCLFLGCRPENEEFDYSPNLVLSYSDSIVVFDTILANTRSTTQRLMVYNRNNKAIKISQIVLGNINNTTFSIAINGKKSNNFNNVEILGRDSLLVLVEVYAPVQSQVYTTSLDSLNFFYNQRTEKVYLFSLNESARILSNKVVTTTEVWNKSRPYLIMDSVIVAKNAKLIIEDSVQVYFFNKAFMRVQGELQLNGKAENLISLKSYRKEFSLENQPALWQGIILDSNSKTTISHAEIRNAIIGIKSINSEVFLESVFIRNMSVHGVYFQNVQATLVNTIFSNCFSSSLQIRDGGKYIFQHCTITDYDYNFFRIQPCLYIDNVSNKALACTFQNSIIWGNRSEELSLSSNVLDKVNFQNSILKTRVNNLSTTQSMVNIDPLFQDSYYQDFRLKEGSPAIAKGAFINILSDYLGVTRTNPPDIGAFQYRKL
jgi:hypothetical protein